MKKLLWKLLLLKKQLINLLSQVLKILIFFYDYTGIDLWVTQKYHECIKYIKDKININFKKVKGYSGIEGNEETNEVNSIRDINDESIFI